MTRAAEGGTTIGSILESPKLSGIGDTESLLISWESHVTASFKTCGIQWVRLRERTSVLKIESTKTTARSALWYPAWHRWAGGERVFPGHPRTSCTQLLEPVSKVLVCKQDIGSPTAQVSSRRIQLHAWHLPDVVQLRSPPHRSQCIQTKGFKPGVISGP